MLKGINRLTSWVIIEHKIVMLVSRKAFSKNENLKKFKGEKIVGMECLTDE